MPRILINAQPPTEAELRERWARRERVNRLATSPRQWYRVERNAVSDEAEIYIYDMIGFWGVSAADFVNELRSVIARKITLHLNSPGGDAWDGIAIYNALVDHPAEIEVHVDALAASAASVIAMAGDRVVMMPSSTMMIHQAWGLVIGNAGDMRKEADVLDKLDAAIAAVYARRAGGDVDTWVAAMREETWYTAQEAVDAGLADEVGRTATADDAQARATNFDLSIFSAPPAAVGAGASPPAPADNHQAEHDRAYADLLLTEIGLTLAH